MKLINISKSRTNYKEFRDVCQYIKPILIKKLFITQIIKTKKAIIYIDCSFALIVNCKLCFYLSIIYTIFTEINHMQESLL